MAPKVAVADPPPGRELRERWEATQFELVTGPYKPYKEILGEATLAWCREFRVPDREVYADAIVGSIRAWQPSRTRVRHSSGRARRDSGSYKPSTANFERRWRRSARSRARSSTSPSASSTTSVRQSSSGWTPPG